VVFDVGDPAVAEAGEVVDDQGGAGGSSSATVS
jgi:hypothetical protein